MATLASRLASLSESGRRAILSTLAPEEVAALGYIWPLWARSDQLPPAGDWRTWLLLGGRGSGKTRSAAEWVRAEIEGGKRRQVGIIGPTADAVRRVMVEGPSGILAVAPPWCRPTFGPATRTITWPNGALAHLFSAEEPDRLRGPNLDAAWCDELASWEAAEAVWTMLQMSLRLPGPLGDAPQVVVSTTPKAGSALKAIIASLNTVTTRARTMDNAVNLDASTLKFLQAKYGGTTLGRQELDAEILDDAEGALWNRALLDESRVPLGKGPTEFRRVVVAVDPSGGGGRKNDECGIIVMGVASDGHGYVIADMSGRFSPDRWARRTVEAYEANRADRIVAEANFGGGMVEATLRAVAPRVPVKMVHASRGKAVRAEPVVALFEQQRIHLVGHFSALEDELCTWEPLGNAPSPGRLDAMVWGATELMIAPGGATKVQRLGY